MFTFICLLLTVFPAVVPLKLPSYITPCRLRQNEYEECATKSARAAVPAFINGDKKYKVPNLNPLEITQLKIDQGTSTVGLQITLKNAKLYGLPESTVEKVSADVANKEFTWYLYTPRLEVLSDYGVKGRVLLLPIFGDGKANITLINPRYTYKWRYSLTEKNGQTYMVPEVGSITYTVDRAHIDLKNLFNGDKLLGPQMNKFLNENWQDAAREIGPSIAEALSRVIDGIIKNICSTVAFKDIFLQ